jgi:hypothetical protein
MRILEISMEQIDKLVREGTTTLSDGDSFVKLESTHHKIFRR